MGTGGVQVLTSLGGAMARGAGVVFRTVRREPPPAKARSAWTDREFVEHINDLGNVCRDMVAAIIVVLCVAFLAHCLADFFTPCQAGVLC